MMKIKASVDLQCKAKSVDELMKIKASVDLECKVKSVDELACHCLHYVSKSAKL